MFNYLIHQITICIKYISIPNYTKLYQIIPKFITQYAVFITQYVVFIHVVSLHVGGYFVLEPDDTTWL